MAPIDFRIEKTLPRTLARAGVLKTAHGSISTPAFVAVGTKATVKSLTPEQVRETGAQVVLANTYHLYLEPGEAEIKAAGGLGAFMQWSGPTMTDSGGFQVFSLGAGIGRNISKVTSAEGPAATAQGREEVARLAAVDPDGVTFRSHLDGSSHRFTPERAIEIQHAIGADIIFAFDECASPEAPESYQREAMVRTHLWAKRSLDHHRMRGQESAPEPGKNPPAPQAIFGIVQGGRFEALRKESATVIGAMDFDGFGIGGSFNKEDMHTAVRWVNEILPPGRPRHLLGIGEPADLFGAVENGCDLFDCVAPTRLARNGALYTRQGRINILNAKFVSDRSPIDAACRCYTCARFSRAYLAHLFRSGEILANTLASIHNLYFIIHLVEEMRQGIIDGTFDKIKDEYLRSAAH